MTVRFDESRGGRARVAGAAAKRIPGGSLDSGSSRAGLQKWRFRDERRGFPLVQQPRPPRSRHFPAGSPGTAHPKGAKKKAFWMRNTQNAFRFTIGGSAGQRLPPWQAIQRACTVPKSDKNPRDRLYPLPQSDLRGSLLTKRGSLDLSDSVAESPKCCNSNVAFILVPTDFSFQRQDLQSASWVLA